MCGFEKEFTTDAADEDPQVVIDTTRDDSKSLTDDPSEETEGANIKERTEENSAEPEGGNTESTVRRSQRETRKSNFYGELVNTAKTVSEPTTVEKAISCSEKKKWKEAMEAEFQSVQTNQVWDLVTPPKDCKVINSKWVFKCKLGEHGQVECYKARWLPRDTHRGQELTMKKLFLP